ncbi:unnamed protein product, partial [Eretmochelys imbricata]
RCPDAGGQPPIPEPPGACPPTLPLRLPSAPARHGAGLGAGPPRGRSQARTAPPPPTRRAPSSDASWRSPPPPSPAGPPSSPPPRPRGRQRGSDQLPPHGPAQRGPGAGQAPPAGQGGAARPPPAVPPKTPAKPLRGTQGAGLGSWQPERGDSCPPSSAPCQASPVPSKPCPPPPPAQPPHEPPIAAKARPPSPAPCPACPRPPSPCQDMLPTAAPHPASPRQALPPAAPHPASPAPRQALPPAARLPASPAPAEGAGPGAGGRTPPRRLGWPQSGARAAGGQVLPIPEGPRLGLPLQDEPLYQTYRQAVIRKEIQRQTLPHSASLSSWDDAPAPPPAPPPGPPGAPRSTLWQDLPAVRESGLLRHISPQERKMQE